MNANIQHSTFNVQRPRIFRRGRFLGYWVFTVLAVFVSHLFAQSSASSLPPLAPALPEMEPTVWEQYGTVIIVAVCVAVVVLMILAGLMLRPKRETIPPPEVLARDALNHLQGRSEDGKLLSAVSQILRRYIVAAFLIPADEMTTTEFLDALASGGRVGRELAQGLGEFLRECDQRKFSGAVPRAPFNAVPRALDFIAELEKQRMCLYAPNERAVPPIPSDR
jgi:hypothetical protein